MGCTQNKDIIVNKNNNKNNKTPSSVSASNLNSNLNCENKNEQIKENIHHNNKNHNNDVSIKTIPIIIDNISNDTNNSINSRTVELINEINTNELNNLERSNNNNIFSNQIENNIQIESDIYEVVIQSQNNENNNIDIIEREKIEKQLKKRQLIINEILTTERSYINNMILTNEIFIEPLQKLTILDSTTISDQFRDYTLIKGLHEQILKEIENSNDETIDFLKIFIRYIPVMKMYRNYLQYYERRFNIRTNLMETNQLYKQFIIKCREDSRCKGHYLESFLVEPVQRIPRYKLLFEQVIFNYYFSFYYFNYYYVKIHNI